MHNLQWQTERLQRLNLWFRNTGIVGKSHGARLSDRLIPDLHSRRDLL